MADRDCAICRGAGKYPVSVDITGKLADCPYCSPEPTNLMHTALVAIQELHNPELWLDGFTLHCAECSGTGETMPTLSPCPTRKLVDEALGEDK